MTAVRQDGWLPAGEPVDLTNCDREPIHLPGAIQPHGVLLAVTEPDLVVRVASANSRDLLGLDPAELLERSLRDLVGGDLLDALSDAAVVAPDPSEHFPISSTIRVAGTAVAVDVLLHHADGLLVVELEPGGGPLSFDSAYRAARTAVGRINRAAAPEQLYAIAAEEVRRLTGFDRVMIYRFDDEWNGQVVAEDKAEHLNSFLGLRYPASDIPAQARALYRRNWLRLIPDLRYSAVPLVPPATPRTGAPLDLSHSSLRSVSPIHVEYLQNMGVSASMSISLLDRGELWGLIACHHYSGPHRPPYEVRAAAEFLGQTLSLRLVASVEEADMRRQLEVRATMAVLTSAVSVEDRPASRALSEGPTTLLDIVPSAGVAVSLDDEYAALGDVPAPRVVRALVAHAVATGEDVVALDSVPSVLPELSGYKDNACGALVVVLSGDQYVVWLRPEQVRTVDWGGDPRNKELAEREGQLRLSPRKSFERWQEVVRLRSEPWRPADVEVASTLRAALMETLYGRARRLATVAQTLQRSMLPDRLPDVTGWSMCASYAPSAGGEVGGDWYDVVVLPDGAVALVLGDVAGHGIAAAGTMAQLRNALRAYLIEDASPSAVLVRLSRLVAELLPSAMATAMVALVQPTGGLVRVATAGHPPVCHVAAAGPGTVVDMRPWPPLGVGVDRLGPPREERLQLAPGDALVLYSDGLIERRNESLDVGLARLAAVTAGGAREVPAMCDRLMSECRDPAGEDDATVLVLGRNAE